MLMHSVDQTACAHGDHKPPNLGVSANAATAAAFPTIAHVPLINTERFKKLLSPLHACACIVTCFVNVHEVEDAGGGPPRLSRRQPAEQGQNEPDEQIMKGNTD